MPGVNSKAELRRSLLAARNGLGKEDRRERDARIEESFFSLEEVRRARTILFYASFKSEVSTQALIGRWIAEGKRALVPKVSPATVEAGDCSLGIYGIGSLEELAPGYMGIPEPVPGRAHRVDSAEADLIVLPGAGFDRRGNRLGYGKGCYDKLLSSLDRRVPFVALAYSCQLVEEIPAEEHDRPVDAVITEEEVIWTKKR